MLQDVRHLALRVQHVAELAGTGRADLQAGRQTPHAGPLQAEGALFHDPFAPRPVGQIGHLRIDLVVGKLGFCKVEAPRPIRTGRLAIAAADAPIVVDHRDAVRLLPGRLHGTDFDARRLDALMALDRHVVLVGVRHRGRRVVVIRALQIDAAFLHLQHADVLDLRRPRLVVLLDTGVHAAPAADAAAEVQAIHEFDPGQGRWIGQLRRDVVPPSDFFANAGEDLGLVLGRHLLVVFLEELGERGEIVRVHVAQGRNRRGHCGNAGQRRKPGRQEAASCHFGSEWRRRRPGRRRLWARGGHDSVFLLGHDVFVGSSPVFAEPQWIVTLAVSAEFVRPHAQRVGTWGRHQRLERGSVRVMTFDALAPRLRPSARVPVAVGSAVRTMLPIAIDRPVALGTQELRLIPGDLISVVVHERIAVGAVMAVEATGIETMLQLDLLVLGQLAVRFRRGRNDPVAVATTVGEHARHVVRLELWLAHRCRIRSPGRYSGRGRNGVQERERIRRPHRRKREQHDGNPQRPAGFRWSGRFTVRHARDPVVQDDGRIRPEQTIPM